MADNYLENAMEDMRMGRYMSALKTRVRDSFKSPKHYYIKEITKENLDRIRDLIREGNKVSFSIPEGHVGSRLARTLKCQYRPLSMGIPSGVIILV